jgi:hypothetical protein
MNNQTSHSRLTLGGVTKHQPTRLGSWPQLAFFIGVLGLLTGCESNSPGPKAPAESRWGQRWRQANPVWRGVHLAVQDNDQADALLLALPGLAAAGVNTVITEVDFGFEYTSHPEVRGDRYVTKAKAGEITAVARANGIRIIPQLNCLGHQSWSKTTLPLLARHPEFDETPGQFPHNEGIYCRSWCPQNPMVNPFVFDLIDELVNAFRADAFHVGMDEVFLIGSQFCPRCRNHDPAKLFATAVNDLHAHIVRDRKVEMLMWSDRLLDAAATGYSEWEASKNGTQGAVDLVPKDIILCDWNYEKRADYPSLALFSKKGFRVWPSGWQPLEASVAFSRFAAQQKDPLVIGYLCTTWGKVKIADAPNWPPVTEPLGFWR